MSLLVLLGATAASLVGVPVIVNAVDMANEEREKEERRRRRYGEANGSSVTTAQPPHNRAVVDGVAPKRRSDGLRDLLGDQERRIAARQEAARIVQEIASRPAPQEEIAPHEVFADWVRNCIAGTPNEHDVIQLGDLINSYIDYSRRRGSELLDREEFLKGLIYFSGTQGFAVVEGGDIVHGRLQEG